jgi:cytoskeletal protein RodZ
MAAHSTDGSAGTTPSTAPAQAAVDPAEFAEYLRAERERRRLTLDQVADETKIAQRHLAALERGDVRNWPGGMYRRAMMRAYAESIGVDREYALQQFEAAFEPPPPAPPAPVVTAEPASGVALWRPSRPLIAVAAVFVGLVLSAVLWRAAATSGAEPVLQTSEPVAAAPERPAETPAVLPAVAQVPASPAAAPPRTTEGSTATTGMQTAPAAPVTVVETDPRLLATEGNLVVTSDPPGARVTVNGIGWGETPVTIKNLELGEKRVRLTMPGYLSQERVVRLSGTSGNANVKLTLQERESGAK